VFGCGGELDLEHFAITDCPHCRLANQLKKLCGLGQVGVCRSVANQGYPKQQRYFAFVGQSTQLCGHCVEGGASISNASQVYIWPCKLEGAALKQPRLRYSIGVKRHEQSTFRTAFRCLGTASLEVPAVGPPSVGTNLADFAEVNMTERPVGHRRFPQVIHGAGCVVVMPCCATHVGM